jgi:hypothetical protein
MSMETKPPAGQKPEPGTASAFEHEDASPSGIVISGMLLAALLIVVFFAMAWSYGIFMKMSPVGQNASPMTDARELPPRPRLQTDPQKEIHDYCQQQAVMLDSYGWIDQSAGIVRIPIDRAMELTIKNGLPSRPKGEVPSDAADPKSGALPVPAEGVTGQCGYLHDEIERSNELKKEVEAEAAEAKEKK